jgi:hypothetical protein
MLRRLFALAALIVASLSLPSAAAAAAPDVQTAWQLLD